MRVVGKVFALALLLTTIGCDRVTKHLATTKLAEMPAQSYFGDTLRLEYAENPGAFLSMGSRLPECARFSLLTVGVALAPETPTLACCKLISACQRFCEWVRIGSFSMPAIDMSHRTYTLNTMRKSLSSGFAQ